MTRPWRRITLHLSQIFLTLGLTFKACLREVRRLRERLARTVAVERRWSLVAVDDAPAVEVVGAELHHHAVLGQDPDVVLAHLPADVSEDLVPVGELDPEERVGQSLDHGALDLDDPVLLGHVLRNRLIGYVYCSDARLLPDARLSVVRLPLLHRPTRDGGLARQPSRGACKTDCS